MRTEKNDNSYNNGANMSDRLKYIAGNSNSRQILRYNNFYRDL